jgi:Carboxypeptidase regulatory-like domain/TonB dependent receptor-like, beta-barrel
MRTFRCLCLLGFSIVLAVWSIPARAQQAQGSIIGTITDATGAAIAGVKVTAVEKDTGFTRSAATHQDGLYEIPLLPPGHYALSAGKEGFKIYNTESPIELLVDQHARIDIQLEVGSQSQSVEVHATAPVTNTENSTVGATFEEQKVAQIPLNGRNFLQVTLLAPGVAPGTANSENSNRGGAINVNGLRESMNSFWLDGLNDTSVAVGTYAVTPPIDSVQEFNMETGLYDARFGTNAGAQVNVVTKNGTEQLHGSLYEYLRNSALDTRNFFDPNVPPFRRNQFGGTVGGPVKIPGVYENHKTFFFAAYEGLRERRSIFQQGRVPTLAERTGDFSGDLSPTCPTQTLLLDPLVLLNPAAPLTVPGNNLGSLLPLVGATGPDPAGAAMVNLYPKPNIPNAACGAANYIAEGNRKIDTDSFATRVDHKWGEKDSFFARFNITSDREFRPFNEDSSLLDYGIIVHNVNTMTGIDWTHLISNTTVNIFKMGYNRWNETLDNQDQGNPFSHTAPLNIAGTQVSGPLSGVPRITFSVYADLGSQTNNPQHGAVNTYEFADTLTHIHGNHSFALGVDIRPIKRGNFTRDRTIRSEFDFSGVATGALVLGALQQSLPPASFNAIAGSLFAACPPGKCSFGSGVADGLLGIPQDWINGFEVNVSGTSTEYDFFGTDTWKVRPNFTLDAGLRYEYNSLVTDKNNHFSNFDFSSTACGAQGALVVAGTSAASVECPQLTPFGTLAFVQVGTKNFGSGPENRALQYPDRNNFAPRLGFAWQPFHNQQTVVRGGYGIFYDQTFGDVYFQRAANPPFVQVNVGQIDKALPALLPALGAGQLSLLSGAIINNAFALAAAPLFPAISPFQVNFQDSFIQEWSFDLQRQLPGSWLIDAGYVGTRGLRLPRVVDPNQPDLSNGMARRFPIFPQDFVYTESSGKSSYHALQLKAERHFARGMAFLLSYTYAHSMDTNSTFFSTDLNANAPQNSLNLAAEKGPSDYDIRHRLSVAYVYDLPFGTGSLRSGSGPVNYAISDWQLAGIITAQTGSPFTPVISGDVSCTGEFQNFATLTDRPDVVGNFYPANQSPNQWVLPSAFSNPFADAGGHCAFGNAGRNILRGPGLSDWDFSLVRHFRLGEKKALEFRAEMFNLFNHANFATPERDVASSSFGQIFNTVQPLAGIASGGPGDPREIQFALRLTF